MNDKIKCPNCDAEFDVEKALAGKLEAHFRAEYQQKIALQSKRFKAEQADLVKRYNAAQNKLEQEKQEHERNKAREKQLFKQRLAQRVAQELAQQSQKIQQETEATFKQQLNLLQQENQIQKQENRELKAKAIQLAEKEHELKDKEEELKLKYRQQLLQERKSIADKARAKEREAAFLKEKEYEKQLADQKKLIEQLKRKAEQGSTQLQGEVQELALEELLRQTYPFDTIQEVPKGIRGADCLQTVVNARQQNCGSIIYESKRTKRFSREWIGKLKQDRVRCKADLAVIVTETLPLNMARFGQIDDVWICGFHEVKSVSLVLREVLLQRQSVKTAQENKGDKMELLYNYLTSTEFTQNVGRVMEVHSEMGHQLNREKIAFHRLWKEREKQIELVKENVAALVGSIKGIAGKELETPSVLELDSYLL